MADNIKSRIKRIEQCFRGMKVEEVEGQNIIYVIVEFPSRWFIQDGLEKKYDIMVQESSDQPGYFYFIGSLDSGEGLLFDAIEENIATMKSIQEKATLLKEKVEELRTLFEDESMTVETLRTLEFVWKGKKKVVPTKSGPKKVEEKKEEVTTEGEEADNNE